MSTIRTTFDTVAPRYDAALGFFQESARRMLPHFDPAVPLRLLDVACGTGNAALALAEGLPRATITGIDFAPAMLAQARAKAAAAQLANVEFREMDMQQLALPPEFDGAVCAFGLFFVDDLERQLRQIAATVKPGGQVLVSCFGAGSFSPCIDRFLDRIVAYGIVPPPLRWLRMATEEQCLALFQSAGLTDVRIRRIDLGSCLEQPEAWWEMVWNGGFRGLVEQLSPAALESFRRAHLAEVEALRAADGIRMELQVLHVVGSIPAGDGDAQK